MFYLKLCIIVTLVRCLYVSVTNIEKNTPKKVIFKDSLVTKTFLFRNLVFQFTIQLLGLTPGVLSTSYQFYQFGLCKVFIAFGIEFKTVYLLVNYQCYSCKCMKRETINLSSKMSRYYLVPIGDYACQRKPGVPHQLMNN